VSATLLPALACGHGRPATGQQSVSSPPVQRAGAVANGHYTLPRFNAQEWWRLDVDGGNYSLVRPAGPDHRAETRAPVRVFGDAPFWRLEYTLPDWPLLLVAEILVGRDGTAWISSAVGGWQRLRALVPLAPALEGEWQVAASERDTLETIAFAPEETRVGRQPKLPSLWVEPEGASAAALLDFEGSVRELRFDGVAGAWAMSLFQTETVALYRGAAPGWADAVGRRGQPPGPMGSRGARYATVQEKALCELLFDGAAARVVASDGKLLAEYAVVGGGGPFVDLEMSERRESFPAHATLAGTGGELQLWDTQHPRPRSTWAVFGTTTSDGLEGRWNVSILHPGEVAPPHALDLTERTARVTIANGRVVTATGWRAGTPARPVLLLQGLESRSGPESVHIFDVTELDRSFVLTERTDDGQRRAAWLLHRGGAPPWSPARRLEADLAALCPLGQAWQQQGPPRQWPEILSTQRDDRRPVLGLAARVMVESLSAVAAVDPGGVRAVYDQTRASFGLPAATCPVVEAVAAVAARR
jgi:hypothetical protein